ncbi:MAG: hypothetical protein JEY79_04295 [Pseudodesulfovibrio sp.]|nr:hypothetical protein [Pseudodesulfovibrio sp.]
MRNLNIFNLAPDRMLKKIRLPHSVNHWRTIEPARFRASDVFQKDQAL